MASRYQVILFVLLVLLGTACAVRGSNSYITWDDFSVEAEVGRWHDISKVIIVAKDGTGDSLTVQGAVDLVPHDNRQRVKILVRPGIYREHVTVPRNKPYVSFIGLQGSNTVITGHAKASDEDGKGHEIGTFRSATVDIESDYFCATEITFENTIIAEHGMKGAQAVAIKISGDKSMFFRVTFIGSQDTLLDDRGKHYFYQCHIEGRMDFIFGTAKSLYQTCTISSTAEKHGAIAAHHRGSPDDDSGFSFVNCTVNGTGKKIDLGRAWGPYARTVYSNCNLDVNISGQRWNDMGDESKRRTVQFGEFGSTGKGAAIQRNEEQWLKPLTYQEARPLLDKTFINADEWLRV